MLTVMAMDTGMTIESEFGSFEHEVMNAGWLPPLPALQLGLQPVEGRRERSLAEAEVANFMHRLYLCQG